MKLNELHQKINELKDSLVVYHGTDKQHGVLKPSLSDYGLAIYVTDNKDLAKAYAEEKGGKVIYKFTLNVSPKEILDLSQTPRDGEIVKIFGNKLSKYAEEVKQIGYVWSDILNLDNRHWSPLANVNVEKALIASGFKALMYNHGPKSTAYAILDPSVLRNQEEIKEQKINERQASVISLASLPEVYKNLPKLGQGLTSIVLDKGDGKVLMFTRDQIKQEWLTRTWGIEIGDVVEELHGIRHKKMEIRDMPVYVIEMPKLYKLNLENQRKVKAEIKKWERTYGEVRYKLGQAGKYPGLEILQQDAMRTFCSEYPDSLLTPIFEFMLNYDNVAVDLAIRNTMQDKDGNIIFVDPLVSKELISVMYGR